MNQEEVISTALFSKGSVTVYGPHNRVLKIYPADELCGYTSGSVTVKRGHSLITYDASGRVINARSAP
jgi:hypothetical protein